MNILFLIFFVSFSMHCMDERPYREATQLACAEELRKIYSKGFEGCVNKSVCGEYGFYGLRYSSEGLCCKCEFKQFPDRFTLCFRCKEPGRNIKSSFHLCYSCGIRIQNVLVDKLKLNDDFKHVDALSMGAMRFLSKLVGFSKSNFTNNFIESIVVLPEDKRLVFNWGDAEKYVTDIFIKYKIFEDAGDPILSNSIIKK